MPSFTFKRAPSSVADYKLISGGDKYTFYGTTATSTGMGCIVNYSVANAIISQSTGWSGILESDYESKRTTVLAGLQTPPNQIYDGGLTYYSLETQAGITFFVISSGNDFSETINCSNGQVEYNVLRNYSTTYNAALRAFLNNESKPLTDEGIDMYYKQRDEAYKSVQDEAVTGGGVDIIGGLG